MASICNDDWASLGVMSGHERKTLRLSVCRAVQAQLGIGVLPVVAARGYALSLGLAVLPLSDAWARRRMLLCVRSEPAADTPLGLLAAHLKAYADSEATLSLPAT